MDATKEGVVPSLCCFGTARVAAAELLQLTTSVDDDSGKDPNGEPPPTSEKTSLDDRDHETWTVKSSVTSIKRQMPANVARKVRVGAALRGEGDDEDDDIAKVGDTGAMIGLAWLWNYGSFVGF